MASDKSGSAEVEKSISYVHRLFKSADIEVGNTFIQSQVEYLLIDIGHIATTTAFLIPKFSAANVIDPSNPGKIEWDFAGKNKLGTFTLRIEERTWQEMFARLRLPISPLLFEHTDSLKVNQAHYETLCHALKPIESTDHGHAVILQGGSGLGKTYCAQYYFYREAAKHHQMVAWFSGASEAVFLQGWKALASQLKSVSSSDKNDDEVIRDWCENKLGQWLFIIDDVNFEALWLAERLPRRGGHVLITTHQSNYSLYPDQQSLVFSPLSLEDSKALLQAYMGEYWEATGYRQDEPALEYLAKVLGGYPVGLTQIGLLARKKVLSFERIADQFKNSLIRNLLLSDTVFEQLRGQTFLASVQKGWDQLLGYFAKYYPQLNREQHEQHLRQFVGFLQNEAQDEASLVSEEKREIRINYDSIKAYWQKALGKLFEEVNFDEFALWLQCLPLSYSGETHQWRLSLAGLSALELQSNEKNLQALLPTTGDEGTDKKPNDIPLQETLLSLKIPEVPSRLHIPLAVKNSVLKDIEIDILTVGNPSEFKVWHLPTVNPYFIPRPSLTEALKEKLPNKKEGEASVQLILTAATGMGGIGKTELARHFITNFELSGTYQRRFWFIAETASQLRMEFRQLALYLGLIETEKYVEDGELVAHVHKWLSIHPGWLMVLDNADNYNSIAEWIPKEGGAVLVTTREPTPGTLSSKHIVQVPLLTPEEAVKWLCQLSGRTPENLLAQEKKSAEDLVEDLGYLPLAIAQAAAYLREQSNISIGEYQKNFIALLEDPTLAEQEQDQEEGAEKNSDVWARRIVVRTWTLSLRAIEASAKERHLISLAQPLLASCVHFAPKNIPILLFEFLLKEFYQVESALVDYVLDEYMGQLICYSLLERNSTDNEVSVHRLVQQVIRKQLYTGPQTVHCFRMSAFCLLKAYPFDKYQNSAMQLKRKLLPHLQVILRNHEEYDAQSIQKLDIHFLLYILTFLSNAHDAIGDAEKSKELLERLLPTVEQDFGKNHVDVASILMNLGNTYWTLGNAQKSKDLLERALSIFEQHYDKDHYQISRVLENLSLAHTDLGDVQKSRELLERALAINGKHYGKNHIEVAHTLTNLGSTYLDFDNAQKGKKLLKRALIINEKYYGKDNIEVAVTLVSLGLAYGVLGNSKKNKKLLERALSILEQYYGKDHYKVASILTSLGAVYVDLGDTQKGKELLERALPIFEQYYGKDHYKVAIILGCLGTAYVDLGDAQKGTELLEHALAINEKHYEKDHIQVIVTLKNLGVAYIALKDTRKGKELFERALPVFEKHYGKDYVNLAGLLAKLGIVYADLGDVQKSKKTLEHALTLNEKRYKKNYIDAAITLRDLSSTYVALGDAHKGKELLERTLPIFEQYYGKDHYKVASILTSLGAVYIDLGDVKKSKEILEHALIMSERHYKKVPIEVAITLKDLGIAYTILGDTHKSKELLERVLPIFEQYYDKNQVDILAALGSVYAALGDTHKGKELLEHALTIDEKRYKKSPIDAAITLRDISGSYIVLGDAHKGKELLEHALPIFEQYYGKDHYKVAGILKDLGAAYIDLGDTQKGKELLERALSVFGQCYGKEHVILAGIFEALGNAYVASGDTQKGKELLEHALNINEKHYGKNHIEVADTLIYFSILYGILDDAQKNKELLERALAIFEQYYGKDHYKVANILTNLGMVYDALGDAQKVKEYFERALLIFEERYGEDHHNVASILTPLGAAYIDLGNLQKGKELLERALNIDEEYYGKGHIKVATTLVNLGRAYLEEENFGESRLCFQKAMKIFNHFDDPQKEKTEFLSNLTYIREGNHLLLQHAKNIENAKLLYQKFDPSFDPEQLETQQECADIFYALNQLPGCIEHNRIMIKLDHRYSPAFHNLACLINAKAQLEKIIGNEAAYTAYLKEAKKYFKKSIAIIPHTGIYTEYAQFMLRNLPHYSIEKVIGTLRKAIQLKQMDKYLSYGIIERITVDAYLQDLIDAHKEIEMNAYFLAHYLLIQAYLLSGRMKKAKKIYDAFNRKSMIIIQELQPGDANQNEESGQALIAVLLKFSEEMLHMPIEELKQLLGFYENKNKEPRENMNLIKHSGRSSQLFCSFFNMKTTFFENGKQVARYLNLRDQQAMACVNQATYQFFQQVSLPRPNQQVREIIRPIEMRTIDQKRKHSADKFKEEKNEKNCRVM